MHGSILRRGWWRLGALVAGATLFQSGGCDATLRATIESGIINASSSFLAALLQALLQVAQDNATMT